MSETSDKTKTKTNKIEEEKSLGAAAPEEVNVEVKKEKSEMNLAEIIRDYCKLKDAPIALTPLLKKSLRKLARTNQINMEKTEQLFDEILKDKKVNMKDLPSIMHLLQELHIMYENLKLKVTSEDIALVLKTCIQLLMLYKLDKNTNINLKDKVQLVEALNVVVDLSIGMMDFKETQKKLKKWFRFIPCM